MSKSKNNRPGCGEWPVLDIAEVAHHDVFGEFTTLSDGDVNIAEIKQHLGLVDANNDPRTNEFALSVLIQTFACSEVVAAVRRQTANACEKCLRFYVNSRHQCEEMRLIDELPLFLQEKGLATADYDMMSPDEQDDIVQELLMRRYGDKKEQQALTIMVKPPEGKVPEGVRREIIQLATLHPRENDPRTLDANVHRHITVDIDLPEKNNAQSTKPDDKTDK